MLGLDWFISKGRIRNTILVLSIDLEVVVGAHNKVPDSGVAGFDIAADFGVAAYDSDLSSVDSGQILHTFPAASFRTVKYIAQIEHDSDNKYHSLNEPSQNRRINQT